MASRASFMRGHLRVAALLCLGIGVTVSSLTAGSVTGAVYVREGDRRVPLPRAKVMARPLDSRSGFFSTRTDAEGRYQLSGLPDQRFILAAHRSGFFTLRVAGHEDVRITLNCSLPDDCTGIDFELVRGAVVTGRVIDELGDPVWRTVLSLTPTDKRESMSYRGFNAASDDRGQFRISGVAPGRYTLKAQGRHQPHGSFTFRRSEPLVLEVEARSEIRGLEIIVTRTPSPSMLRVSGRVTGIDLSGDFTHFLTMQSREISASRSLGQDGSFSFDISPGVYSFVYSRRTDPRRRQASHSRALGRIEVSQDVSGLVLMPSQPTGFSGRVTFEAGAPPADVTVWLSSDDTPARGRAFAKGPEYDFKVTHLLPGMYRLGASSGRRYVRESFYVKGIRRGSELAPPTGLRLSEGQIEEIEVVLAADFAMVEGRVKAAGTEPGQIRKGAQYRVGLKGPRGIRTVQADQRGRFSFDHVVPGDYRIGAWPDLVDRQIRADEVWEEAGSAVREFPAEPGAEIEIDLTAAR